MGRKQDSQARNPFCVRNIRTNGLDPIFVEPMLHILTLARASLNQYLSIRIHCDGMMRISAVRLVTYVCVTSTQHSVIEDTMIFPARQIWAVHYVGVGAPRRPSHS